MSSLLAKIQDPMVSCKGMNFELSSFEISPEAAAVLHKEEHHFWIKSKYVLQMINSDINTWEQHYCYARNIIFLFIFWLMLLFHLHYNCFLSDISISNCITIVFYLTSQFQHTSFPFTPPFSPHLILGEREPRVSQSLFTCGTQVLKQSFQYQFYDFDPPHPGFHLEVFLQA